jgi:hypothetical protein
VPDGYLDFRWGAAITSVDGSLFVGKAVGSFATTDGIQPWSVVSEWVTGANSFNGLSPLLWTDGRFAGSTRAFGGSTNSIVVCGLGLE